MFKLHKCGLFLFMQFLLASEINFMFSLAWTLSHTQKTLDKSRLLVLVVVRRRLSSFWSKSHHLCLWGGLSEIIFSFSFETDMCCYILVGWVTAELASSYLLSIQLAGFCIILSLLHINFDFFLFFFFFLQSLKKVLTQRWFTPSCILSGLTAESCPSPLRIRIECFPCLWK